MQILSPRARSPTPQVGDGASLRLCELSSAGAQQRGEQETSSRQIAERATQHQQQQHKLSVVVERRELPSETGAVSHKLERAERDADAAAPRATAKPSVSSDAGSTGALGQHIAHE